MLISIKMTDISGNDQYHGFPMETKISTMTSIPLPLSCSVNGMGQHQFTAQLDPIGLRSFHPKQSTNILHGKRESNNGNVAIIVQKQLRSSVDPKNVIDILLLYILELARSL